MVRAACWRRDIVGDEIAIPAAARVTRRRPIQFNMRFANILRAPAAGTIRRRRAVVRPA
jgi:hypothetical protein